MAACERVGEPVKEKILSCLTVDHPGNSLAKKTGTETGKENQFLKILRTEVGCVGVKGAQLRHQRSCEGEFRRRRRRSCNCLALGQIISCSETGSHNESVCITHVIALIIPVSEIAS